MEPPELVERIEPSMLSATPVRRRIVEGLLSKRIMAAMFAEA
jgi:hypothetical protein